MPAWNRTVDGRDKRSLFISFQAARADSAAEAPRALSMIDLFFQESRSDRLPLRIGLVLDGYELPRVFAQQIDGIQRCNFARLELVVMSTTLSSDLRARQARSFPDRIWSVLGDATVRRRLLYSLYERWDRERVSPSINPRALVDYSARLTGIDTIPIMKDSPGFHAEVAEAIHAKNLDVLVQFGFNTQEIAELTRTRYREVPVATVRPWLRGQTGTHTYNRCEGLEVIDGSFRY